MVCAKVYNVCVECERVNICMVNSLETFSMISGAHNVEACIYLENEEDILCHYNERRVRQIGEKIRITRRTYIHSHTDENDICAVRK